MERPRIWRACLLWAVLVSPALTADRLGMNEPRAVWQQVAGAVVLAAAVAVAQRQPLAAFALTAVLGLAAAPALFTVSYGPALGVFALLLGLRAARVRPALVVFGAVGCLGTARIALFGVDPAPEGVVLTGTLLFGCVFPWLGGRYWRQSRQLAEAGWTRAARLEGEQRIAEERARLRERARIAQDMHDSLGHELSLIALRAGALQVAPDLPDHHRTAAADLRAAAADATERLHRIIGVLREKDEPVSLTPPGETVEQLVARAAESGLAVRWEALGGGDVVWRTESVGAQLTGAVGGGAVAWPAEPTRDGARGHSTALEPGGIAERVVYRVVREALTNAARHAPGAEVTVAAAREADGVTVTVTSGQGSAVGGAPPGRQGTPEGPHAPDTPHAPAHPGGTGLQALRAAVTAVGGGFEAGPYGDGFRVRAYVPERAAATAVRPNATGASAPYAPFTRARRRIALAFAAAVGAGVVLVGGAFAWYAYTETHSVLSPAAYSELRLGASAHDLAGVLPDRTARDAPVERAPEPPPKGSACRYYRASGELLVSVDHFRLCFDDAGRLIAKTVIPRAGLSQRPSTDEEFAR
ncbi:histidine kinase [Streptomyces bicolor]|uniref:histidine kinase n=1 Tax=Streptomyces bicolor TaxID=66874 RepID=UPI0005642AE2|nr:histidine kinase [Streptomyces bicolor]